MKKLLLVIALCFAVVTAKADIFVLDIPPLPDKANRENYEEEPMFSMTVLQYYTLAANYEAVLKLKGLKPAEKVTPPSMENLEDGDFKIIEKYYKIADNLKKQYEDTKSNYRDEELEKLFSQVLECSEKNLELQTENRKLVLANLNKEFYAEKIQGFLEELERKNFIVDSLTWAIYKAKSDTYQHITKELNNINQNKYPVFSLYASTNKHYYYNDLLDSRIGFMGAVTFNPGPILHIGRYFDFRFGIGQYPLNYSGVRFDINSIEYNMDLIFPIGKIFDFKHFNMEFKLGLGFFNTTAKEYNLGIMDTEWNGELVRLELCAFNFGTEFPIGVNVSYNFYHNSRGINLNTTKGNSIIINNLWTNNLSLGCSFPLWNKVMY